MDTANLTPVRLINWIFSGKTSEHTSLVPESKEITHDKLINEAGTQIILNGMTPKSFTNSIWAQNPIPDYFTTQISYKNSDLSVKDTQDETPSLNQIKLKDLKKHLPKDFKKLDRNLQFELVLKEGIGHLIADSELERYSNGVRLEREELFNMVFSLIYENVGQQDTDIINDWVLCPIRLPRPSLIRDTELEELKNTWKC